jgi:hypothetical protein
MIVVVIASLVLTVIVIRREQAQRTIAVNAARAAYENAKLTREVAEIAVTEYVEGISEQIRLGENDTQRAQDRLAWSKRMSPTKTMTTKDQIVEELKSEAKRARADELARKAEYDRLKAIAARLFW